MNNHAASLAKVFVTLCWLLGIACLAAGNARAVSIEALRMAAERGVEDAQLQLALKYALGDGVPQDYKESAKLAHKCAEQGNGDCQALLGSMYNGGEGLPANKREAEKWWRQCAEQANPICQFNLGAMMLHGEAVTQNVEEAYDLINKAAKQEYPDAQKFLKEHVRQVDKGAPQNDKEAAKWFRRCAEQGDADCQFRLAIMYGLGRGVARDDVTARTWLEKAAKQGHSGAQKGLRELDQAQAEVGRLEQEWERCSSRCKAEGMTCLANCETIADETISDSYRRWGNCKQLCREAAKSCGRSCGAQSPNDACLARGEAEAITCLANCETIADGYRRGECERSCREFAKSYRCR